MELTGLTCNSFGHRQNQFELNATSTFSRPVVANSLSKWKRWSVFEIHVAIDTSVGSRSFLKWSIGFVLESKQNSVIVCCFDQTSWVQSIDESLLFSFWTASRSSYFWSSRNLHLQDLRPLWTYRIAYNEILILFRVGKSWNTCVNFLNSLHLIPW